MTSFVGRTAEIKALDDELAEVAKSGRGRFVWMRGRRRVGKSRLVQEFCDASGRSYCFYQAPRRDRDDALREFVEGVAESTLPAAETFVDATFSAWPAALRAAVAGADADRPVIVVIDELPYLTEHDDGFTADLQKAWDRTLEASAVLLICVGSDVRMMEERVAERSPLHGRPTKEMRVAPLDPVAVGTITGADDPADVIDRYLMVGGFPLLAAMWPHGAGVSEFLHHALADDESPLVTTAERIMAAELPGDGLARRVIEAIGHGETAHGRIQSRSGVKGNTLSAALAMLSEAKGLIVKTLPLAVPPGKKPARYLIADPYLRFWLRFIGPNLAELSRGRADLTIGRVLRDFASYRGRAVEPLVRSSLERLLADEHFSSTLGDARNVGSYWTRTHDMEVDLVGADSPDPASIGFVGSVKWHEHEPFTAREAVALAEHRARVPGAAGAKLLAVTATRIAPGAAVDVVLRPQELLEAWA